MERRHLLIGFLIVVALAVAFFISPKRRAPNGSSETYVVTVEYDGGTDLTPFQGRFFHIGGRTYVDSDVNQSSIRLRKGDVLNIRLLEYPTTVSLFFVSENHLLFTEETAGFLDSRKITRNFLMSFLAAYDGNFSLDIGVLEQPFYDYRGSTGRWIFEVTID